MGLRGRRDPRWRRISQEFILRYAQLFRQGKIPSPGLASSPSACCNSCCKTSFDGLRTGFHDNRGIRLTTPGSCAHRDWGPSTRRHAQPRERRFASSGHVTSRPLGRFAAGGLGGEISIGQVRALPPVFASRTPSPGMRTSLVLVGLLALGGACRSATACRGRGSHLPRAQVPRSRSTSPSVSWLRVRSMAPSSACISRADA